jgi:anthranilate/para-aminobenzoate synthase component I
MTTERRTTATPGAVAMRIPELDAVAPIDAAERLRHLPGLALLESARPGRNARWTYLSADPVAVVDAPAQGADVFESARRALARLCSSRFTEADSPPFTGGLMGYLSYDLGRRFESIPSQAAVDQDLPLLRLALHDWAVAWDRRRGLAWLVGRSVDERIDRLDRRLAWAREVLVRPAGPTPRGDDPTAERAFELRSGLDRAA